MSVRRISAILLAGLLAVVVAPPARAASNYTHLGATSNVALSVQWSRELFADDDAVDAVLARDDTFADSLAAGALAGALDAPVLLHPTTGGLDDRIAAELGRVGVDRVLVIGGTAAISPATVADLQDGGYEVVRLAGVNRVDTAVKVYEQATYQDGERVYAASGTVYLARAFGAGSAAFADSLGAGMLAGTESRPLLLTDTAHLSAETAAAIDRASAVQFAIIVGGTAAVSETVADELRARGIDVLRIAGVTRFDTAREVAEQSFNAGVVTLVDGFHGNSWASGYPASAKAFGAVLLSDGGSLPTQTEAFLEERGPARLVCAPEVSHDACVAADSALNG